MRVLGYDIWFCTNWPPMFYIGRDYYDCWHYYVHLGVVGFGASGFGVLEMLFGDLDPEQSR